MKVYNILWYTYNLCNFVRFTFFNLKRKIYSLLLPLDTNRRRPLVQRDASVDFAYKKKAAQAYLYMCTWEEKRNENNNNSCFETLNKHFLKIKTSKKEKRILYTFNSSFIFVTSVTLYFRITNSFFCVAIRLFAKKKKLQRALMNFCIILYFLFRLCNSF